MPNLKHLLDELEELDVDPRQVRLPGPLYDGLVDQTESEAEENPTEED
ncbi:hypothetical protein ACFLUU_03095 [Chloroflexota bacterium]